MRLLKIIVFIVLGKILVLGVLLLVLVQKPEPPQITYGMSFNTVYARELGLDWQETFDAIVDDLGVRHFRLAAHWPMVEPQSGVYNFFELDYQLEKLASVDGTAILAVGRRLPRWPECHIPDWARDLSWEEQQNHLRAYMQAVVERYRDSEVIKVWQVENEPFLSLFAFEHCGPLDEVFLDEQIALVRELDDSRPILVTDSGNLGTWHKAFQRGDMFGTSVYVHFWNPDLGQFRTVLPAWFYRAKENVMKIAYGNKPTVLIELSVEPWLVAPVVEVPLEVQFTRMDLEKIQDIIAYAKKTRYDTQYLWGAEWWYWLLGQGERDMWEFGQQLFQSPVDDVN